MRTFEKKYQSFNWNTIRVDGNNHFKIIMLLKNF